jgi:hypothetical protein
MSVTFLQQIAATPLPTSYNDPEDIAAVKILCQAGLVLALVDEPPERVARVLAITGTGRAELLRFHYPDEHVARVAGKETWLQLAARRAREAIQARTSGRRR